MDSRWLRGCNTEQEREDRRAKVKSYKTAFNELISILEKEVTDTSPDYSSPSWAYQQADRNGANRKLQEIINLITIKD